MKLCQTLRLHLMGGRLMSKKRGKTCQNRFFWRQKALCLPQQIPTTCPHNNHKKPPIHISIVINSMKSLGMNTIFL